MVQHQTKPATPNFLNVHSPSSRNVTHVSNVTSPSYQENNDHTTSDYNSTIPVLNRRVDLSSMIESFTSYLGRDNWTKYARILSLFILGKLSRKEMTNELDIIFNIPHSNRASLIRLHNQLLLGILTNSLKDSPLSKKGSTWGFQNDSSGINSSSSKLRRVNKHNSQIELYKKIVMSLPITDRNRLKAITREAGKKGFVYCSVLQTRLKNIPKIPIVTNPDTLKRVKTNNLKTPLEWSQDIMNGFNTPLATDNYSLPDADSLYLRMVSIAREHGLVGNVDARGIELLSMALDHYLKNIIEFTIDTVRYRRKKYSEYYDLNDAGIYRPVAQAAPDSVIEEIDNMPNALISLTGEDLYNTISIFPNLVKPTSGAYHDITTLGLINDDDLVINKSGIDDLSEFLNEKPLFTPLDEKNIGTRDELNWLIKDILTKE